MHVWSNLTLSSLSLIRPSLLQTLSQLRQPSNHYIEYPLLSIWLHKTLASNSRHLPQHLPCPGGRQFQCHHQLGTQVSASVYYWAPSMWRYTSNSCDQCRAGRILHTSSGAKFEEQRPLLPTPIHVLRNSNCRLSTIRGRMLWLCPSTSACNQVRYWMHRCTLWSHHDPLEDSQWELKWANPSMSHQPLSSLIGDDHRITVLA